MHYLEATRLASKESYIKSQEWTFHLEIHKKDSPHAA